MNRTARIALFGLAWLVLLPAIGVLAYHMPAFGAHALPYGDLIDQVAPPERHVANTISAVNFDYRGFDTLGEELVSTLITCDCSAGVRALGGRR